MMNKVIEAARFADNAHRGQFRKYSHSHHPYIIHPLRVMSAVMLHPDATEEMVAAAALHDVVEDTPTTVAELEARFGPEVSSLVGWLTNPSKKVAGTREFQKTMDKEHLAKAPWEVKLIKLVDRLDNLRELNGDPMVPHGFQKLYRKESKALLQDALAGVDEELWAKAMSYTE